jgi:3-hydroxybutyrate dehydrogenase
LVKSVALEAGPYGVTVNVIAPGGVDGERLRRLFRATAETRGESEADVLARFTSGTALKRLSASEDVATALLYLVGQGGRNITGQDMIVDAGTIV